MRDKILTFLKGTFSEPTGEGSASRVLAGVAIVACITWISYIVFSQRHLPDMSGPAMWLASAFSGYGLNKLSGAIESSKKTLDK
jgi:hypothetical protein